VLSYLQKPLMTLPAVVGLRSLYVEKNKPNQLRKKSYLLYSDFNIIIPNKSICSFHLQFSTLNTSHQTPFMYASIFSPHRCAVTRSCHDKTKTLLYRFVYRGSQCHCAADQLWRCTVLQREVPHRSQQMTPVT